jgi:chromosome segregation ATPase
MARINQFSKEAKVDSLRPISENPRFAEAAEKLARFNQEIALARKEIDRVNRDWYSAKQNSTSSENAIAAADALLDGAPSDVSDAPAKLHDLDRKLAILRAGAARQTELVDRIRGELSVEAGKVVQAQHRKALAKILEAARQLVEAAAAERAIRGLLLDHGFEVIESITPPPRFAAPLIIGDESWYDSPLSHFKRHLEELGIPT